MGQRIRIQGDDSKQVTTTEVGNDVALDVNLAGGDIQIGAVEIKDGASDNRAEVNSSGALKVSGGGSAGGSGIVVGYEKGGYSFNASAQTVTLTGFTSIDLGQIQQITNITDGIVLYSPSADDKTATMTSNIITLAYDTTSMSDGDELQIYLQYNNSEDFGVGAKKTSEQNPEYAHTTSVEHPVDATNQTAASYRTIIQMDTYVAASLHLKGSGGVTFTVWASNDSTADDTADTGWVDISSTVLGAASLVDSEGIYFLDTRIVVDRIMIKHVTSDASNATDIWIKKGY